MTPLPTQHGVNHNPPKEHLGKGIQSALISINDTSWLRRGMGHPHEHKDSCLAGRIGGIVAMWFSDSRVNHLHSWCDSLALDFSQPQHHFLQCERRTSPLTLPSRLRPSWAFPPRTWAVQCTALFFAVPVAAVTVPEALRHARSAGRNHLSVNGCDVTHPAGCRCPAATAASARCPASGRT